MFQFALLPSGILTYKEEQNLSKKIQSKKASKRTKRAAVEQLVTHNIGFAISEARKVKPGDEDLEQVHIIALHEAAWKYKPNKGTKFISYARWWMKARRHAYFCKFSTQVSIPLNYRALVSPNHGLPFPSEISLNELFQNHHGGDTERIDQFNLDEEGVATWKTCWWTPPLDEVDRPLMISTIHKLILDKIYQLPETKRKVMLTYIEGEDNISKIGRQVGKTRERCRQIKAEVFAQLRISLEPHRDIISELLA